MKTASQFAEVARQAARDTAVVMTAQLRQECVASGWSAALANKLKVRYVGGEFKVIIPEDIKDEINNLEYGTPATQPTAAIRRFSNRLETAEGFLLKRAKGLLGGAL